MRGRSASKRFRNYWGLVRVARSGFPWEKTTKRSLALVYTNCETASALRERVELDHAL
jgi:hypothetical protein